MIRLEAYSADVCNEYYGRNYPSRRIASCDRLGSSAPGRTHQASELSRTVPHLRPPRSRSHKRSSGERFRILSRPGDDGKLSQRMAPQASGGSKLVLPEGCKFITQAIWGSIGYYPGSSFSVRWKAAPQRRHILLIGDDGSFQLTAQELSTILRHDLKPLIFLINNGRLYDRTHHLGFACQVQNDVANWHYAGPSASLQPPRSGVTCRCHV